MYETLHTLGISTVFEQDAGLITHIIFTDWHNHIFKHKLIEPTCSAEHATQIAAGICVGAMINLATKDGKVF